MLIAAASFAGGMAIADRHGPLHARVESLNSGSRDGGPGGQGRGQDDNGAQGGGRQGQGQDQGQGRGQDDQSRRMVGIVAAGQITSIEGSTLVVDGRRGTVTVLTDARTLVEQDLGGSVSALQVGDLVFVAGSVSADGTVTARAIADRPQFAGVDPGQQGRGSDDPGQGSGGDG